jgi:hypothetical protein
VSNSSPAAWSSPPPRQYPLHGLPHGVFQARTAQRIALPASYLSFRLILGLGKTRRRCVFLDGAIHAPHDLPGTILLPLGDFEVPKLFLCGVAERQTWCEFE